MITCPKCQSTLPDWATTCQFCQADVSKIARPPAPVQTKKVYGFGPAPWVDVAYYVIPSWWILGSLGEAAVDVGTKSFDVGSVASVLLTVVFSVGFMLKVEFFRGIANIFAWIKIVLSGWMVITSIGLMMVLPVVGIIGMIWGIVNVVTAGLLIYVIGETGPQ